MEGWKERRAGSRKETQEKDANGREPWAKQEAEARAGKCACSNALAAKTRAQERQTGKGHRAKSLSSPQKVLLVSRSKHSAEWGEGYEQT